MSHEIRHTRYVTRNTSHEICHSIYVTRGTSLEIRHTRYVTRSTSLEIRHTRYVTRGTSHEIVTRRTSLEIRHKRYVTRGTSLEIRHSIPLFPAFWINFVDILDQVPAMNKTCTYKGQRKRSNRPRYTSVLEVVRRPMIPYAMWNLQHSPHTALTVTYSTHLTPHSQ